MIAARTGEGAAARVTPGDVGPEAIAALVAQGAASLALPTSDHAPAESALALLVAVTHDLRSPLGAMLVLIERLRAGQAGPVTPQQEEQLSVLYAAALGASTLTRDALDLARGGGHTAYGPAVPFSLAATWQAVRALVHPIAEERRLALRWSGPAADRRVGHEAALHRVLLNLVTNALKYTERGAVTVTVADHGPGLVRVEVADSGIGLPPTVQRYLRPGLSTAAPTSDDPASPSTRLGLVMCQHLLASLGSRLELESTGAGGTRLAFTLALPCPA